MKWNERQERDNCVTGIPASHHELQEIHEATVDELNALKRWVYGRRRERILEGDGQQRRRFRFAR
jgi:hypothetical protein